MPYVTKSERDRINDGELPVNVGQLTYKLSHVCAQYLGNGYFFADLAEVLGALEATKQELYRRVVGPYEDAKLASNGDIYADRPVIRPPYNADSTK